MSRLPWSILNARQMQKLRQKIIEGNASVAEILELVASHEIIRARCLILQEKLRDTK